MGSDASKAGGLSRRQREQRPERAGMARLYASGYATIVLEASAMTPRVTVVVIPRERFSMAVRALDVLYERTDFPFSLVYVDAGSPRPVRRAIESRQHAKRFRLIRVEDHLAPNESRNLALAHVETPYVVFIDNDVLVQPGWLEALVRCADETAAALVGPLYCIGPPELETVHMAGGIAGPVEENGQRLFRERHFQPGKPFATLRPQLSRAKTELVEFHCLLARRDVFDRLGPLDEGLLTANEHPDLCASVRQAGGTVYLEPAAVVTWMAPPPVAWSDLGFFLLRWSDAWNLSTLCHFREKWQLDADPRLPWQLDWLRDYRHRGLGLHRLRAGIRRVLGWRLGGWVYARLDVVVRGLERLLIRLLARDGRRGRHRLDYRREDLTASRAERRGG
jgi:GT2 family glycosyltransferase